MTLVLDLGGGGGFEVIGRGRNISHNETEHYYFRVVKPSFLLRWKLAVFLHQAAVGIGVEIRSQNTTIMAGVGMELIRSERGW